MLDVYCIINRNLKYPSVIQVKVESMENHAHRDVSLKVEYDVQTLMCFHCTGFGHWTSLYDSQDVIDGQCCGRTTCLITLTENAEIKAKIKLKKKDTFVGARIMVCQSRIQRKNRYMYR